MSAIQYIIEANPYQQEELIALLTDLEPMGFEEKEQELVAYFESDGNLQLVADILKGYDYAVSDVEDQNWNELWESNFKPVKIGNFCTIRADFHQPDTEAQHELIITPKMSFGTGHHATTFMMIEQMKEMDFRNKSVFDFGTGTGVLAILAEKSGAATVTAIDVDEWSINNTVENMERNGCVRINVSQSSQLPSDRFDIILANINRHVLLDYMEQLGRLINPNGSVLLSGLMVADKEVIIEASLPNGWKLTRLIEKDNWISLLFVNGIG
jgi:ribosomal protein L11 methyltransferase